MHGTGKLFGRKDNSATLSRQHTCYKDGRVHWHMLPGIFQHTKDPLHKCTGSDGFVFIAVDRVLNLQQRQDTVHTANDYLLQRPQLVGRGSGRSSVDNLEQDSKS